MYGSRTTVYLAPDSELISCQGSCDSAASPVLTVALILNPYLCPRSLHTSEPQLTGICSDLKLGSLPSQDPSPRTHVSFPGCHTRRTRQALGAIYKSDLDRRVHGFGGVKKNTSAARPPLTRIQESTKKAAKSWPQPTDLGRFYLFLDGEGVDIQDACYWELF